MEEWRSTALKITFSFSYALMFTVTLYCSSTSIYLVTPLVFIEVRIAEEMYNVLLSTYRYIFLKQHYINAFGKRAMCIGKRFPIVLCV